jgi:DNA gyrase subunit A
VQPGEGILALVGSGDEALVLVSGAGLAKRLDPAELAASRDGATIISLEADDRLVAAFPLGADGDVVVVASDAQALRTAAVGIPVQGRGARGVAGMRLRSGARAVAAGPAMDGGVVVAISDRDGLKLTAVDDLPSQGRASGGVRLARLRPDEGGVRQAAVTGTAAPWCLLGQPDDPGRVDPQPQPLPAAVTRRDGPMTRTARRVVALGTARW